jgi:hypothetical protein
VVGGVVGGDGLVVGEVVGGGGLVAGGVVGGGGLVAGGVVGGDGLVVDEAAEVAAVYVNAEGAVHRILPYWSNSTTSTGPGTVAGGVCTVSVPSMLLTGAGARTSLK